MARRDAMINFHVEAILILVPISGARSKSLLRKEIDSFITATLVPAQPPKGAKCHGGVSVDGGVAYQ